MSNLSDAFTESVMVLKQAKKVCILSGAGISAESGIPTFRDKQTGLWEQYRAEDLANINAFKRDPKLVWSWYQWRRNLVKDKKPNAAHTAIAAWQTKWQAAMKDSSKKVTLITQNVDDLHEQAGSQATHLHGHLWQNRCIDCNKAYEHAIDYEDDTLINCEHCGSYIRPDIVWFGEMLPTNAWQHAKNSAINCDVFMSIGTSSIVYPAAGLATLAKQNGATIIEVNPNPTANTVVDFTLANKAGEVLPKLVSEILK